MLKGPNCKFSHHIDLVSISVLSFLFFLLKALLLLLQGHLDAKVTVQYLNSGGQHPMEAALCHAGPTRLPHFGGSIEYNKPNSNEKPQIFVKTKLTCCQGCHS